MCLLTHVLVKKNCSLFKEILEGKKKKVLTTNRFYSGKQRKFSYFIYRGEKKKNPVCFGLI